VAYLLVVVVLARDLDLLGDEVGRVEANTKLTNHRDVSTGLEGLHERLGARLGNGAEVVDEVGLEKTIHGWLKYPRRVTGGEKTTHLGHANTAVTDREGLLGLVGDELNEQLLARVELAGVGERLIANLTHEEEKKGQQGKRQKKKRTRGKKRKGGKEGKRKIVPCRGRPRRWR